MLGRNDLGIMKVDNEAIEERLLFPPTLAKPSRSVKGLLSNFLKIALGSLSDTTTGSPERLKVDDKWFSRLGVGDLPLVVGRSSISWRHKECLGEALPCR
jgi:hypothetical protein